MTIMGGFEIANEMMRMIDMPEWKDAWLDHAARYKKKAWELSHSRFRISRLMAYAAYHLRDRQMAEEAWTDLFTRLEHTPAPFFRITTILPPEVPAPLDEVQASARMMLPFGVSTLFICRKLFRGMNNRTVDFLALHHIPALELE